MKRDNCSKIGLGTVQFGMAYGISNYDGQTPADEVKSIIDYAGDNGVFVIDTASGYGNSESVLGDNDLSKFNIVSKFLPPDRNERIESQLISSLERLRLPSLYGYLAHRPLDVLDHEDQWKELVELRDRGIVRKIGFSFYEPRELEMVLDRGWFPDLVQVPYNYFDDRFESLMMILNQGGCEVHTRSAFLQGLFFSDTKRLSAFFDVVKPLIQQIQENSEDLPGMLLNYCIDKPFIDRVVIGVNNINQLVSNLHGVKTHRRLEKLSSYIPEDIKIPSKWRL